MSLSRPDFQQQSRSKILLSSQIKHFVNQVYRPKTMLQSSRNVQLAECCNPLLTFNEQTDENETWLNKLLTSVNLRRPNTYGRFSKSKGSDDSVIKIDLFLKKYYSQDIVGNAFHYSRPFILATLRENLLLIDEAFHNDHQKYKEQLEVIRGVCSEVIRQKQYWDDVPRSISRAFGNGEEDVEFSCLMSTIDRNINKRISELEESCRSQSLQNASRNIYNLLNENVVPNLQIALLHFIFSCPKRIPRDLFTDETYAQLFKNESFTWELFRNSPRLGKADPIFAFIWNPEIFAIVQKYFFAPILQRLRDEFDRETIKARRQYLSKMVTDSSQDSSRESRVVIEEIDDEAKVPAGVEPRESALVRVPRRQPQGSLNDLITPQMRTIASQYQAAKQEKQREEAILAVLPPIFRDFLLNSKSKDAKAVKILKDYLRTLNSTFNDLYKIIEIRSDMEHLLRDGRNLGNMLKAFGFDQCRILCEDIETAKANLCAHLKELADLQRDLRSFSKLKTKDWVGSADIALTTTNEVIAALKQLEDQSTVLARSLSAKETAENMEEAANSLACLMFRQTLFGGHSLNTSQAYPVLEYLTYSAQRAANASQALERETEEAQAALMRGDHKRSLEGDLRLPSLPGQPSRQKIEQPLPQQRIGQPPRLPLPPPPPPPSSSQSEVPEESASNQLLIQKLEKQKEKLSQYRNTLLRVKERFNRDNDVSFQILHLGWWRIPLWATLVGFAVHCAAMGLAKLYRWLKKEEIKNERKIYKDLESCIDASKLRIQAIESDIAVCRDMGGMRGAQREGFLIYLLKKEKAALLEYQDQTSINSKVSGRNAGVLSDIAGINQEIKDDLETIETEIRRYHEKPEENNEHKEADEQKDADVQEENNRGPRVASLSFFSPPASPQVKKETLGNIRHLTSENLEHYAAQMLRMLFEQQMPLKPLDALLDELGDKIADARVRERIIRYTQTQLDEALADFANKLLAELSRSSGGMIHELKDKAAQGPSAVDKNRYAKLFSVVLDDIGKKDQVSITNPHVREAIYKEVWKKLPHYQPVANRYAPR